MKIAKYFDGGIKTCGALGFIRKHRCGQCHSPLQLVAISKSAGFKSVMGIWVICPNCTSITHPRDRDFLAFATGLDDIREKFSQLVRRKGGPPDVVEMPVFSYPHLNELPKLRIVLPK